MIVSLTLICLWRAWKERWPFLKGLFPAAAFILAFLLVGRVIWDATFVPLPLDLPWSDEWTYLFGVTIIPMLAFVVVPPYEALDSMRRIGVWIGTLTIFMVIAASLYTLRNATGFSRLSTDILNPISLAQMAVACLIVINAQAIAGVPKKSRRRLKSLGRWLMTLLCILIVIATVSKGPILALFSVVVLAMLFRGSLDGRARGLFQRLFLMVLALSAALGVLLLVDAYTPIQVVSRFANAGADTSTSTRLDLIDGALMQFGESPILGSSFVEYSSRFYPHNIIVEVMMTNGSLGLAALVILLFGCFYYVGRMLWSVPSERWIALLFVQYFIVSMFSGSLYFDATTWASMLVTLACGQAEAIFRERDGYAGPTIQQS
jgi:O-antigen ligase